MRESLGNGRVGRRRSKSVEKGGRNRMRRSSVDSTGICESSGSVDSSSGTSTSSRKKKRRKSEKESKRSVIEIED